MYKLSQQRIKKQQKRFFWEISTKKCYHYKKKDLTHFYMCGIVNR